MQLTLVKGEKIFKRPKLAKNSVLKTIRDNDNKPIGDLWGNCQVVYLKTNFRQDEGNPWNELLNRIRICAPTLDDTRELNS